MFKVDTAITKKTIELIRSINLDLELFVTVSFPTGLSINRHTGFLVTPVKFHDERWDIDISYKIKNNEALTEVELKYIWDRILFRLVQTCFNNWAIPFKDDNYVQHLMALLILCVGYYNNTTLEYYHMVLQDIVHFISSEMSELTEIKAISMILYMPRADRIKKCLAANKLFMNSVNISDNSITYAPVNSVRRQTK